MTFKELRSVLGAYYRCQIYDPNHLAIGGFFDVNTVTGEGVDYADDLAEMSTEVILVETVFCESYGFHVPVVVYKILNYMDVSHKPMVEFYNYKKFGFKYYRHQNFICPNCGEVLNAGPEYQPKFAPCCGVELDWSGVEFVPDKAID